MVCTTTCRELCWGTLGLSIDQYLPYPVVPPPPSGVTATALNSTALLVSWQPFNEEDVPGILTNFTIRYNLVHHGGHPNYQGLARDQ